MRNAFIEVLTELATSDPRTILITGDLGFGVLTDFAKKFPRQYINAGVAEQSMMGMAVGMAMEGYIVYTYSIGNFPTLRCLEQIRNDACYHQANVKIIALGGGFAYGAHGMSHHATESLSIMRALPNMTVIAPGDPVEVRHAVRAVHEKQGPCYLHLGRGGEPVVHKNEINFSLGSPICVREGGRVAFCVNGSILPNVVQAAQILTAQDVEASVWSTPTLDPWDEKFIPALAKTNEWIITVEEHLRDGALGGLVAETLAELPAPKARLLRIGLPRKYCSAVGSQEYLRELMGLSPEKIAEKVLHTVG